jgi:tetratricopeptide (TPR) repeat protein
MTTLRSTEDFSWNFSEDPLGEVDPQVDDPEAVYKQLMTDAQASIGRCDYETALHICDVAMTLKPNDVPALYSKAICYANLPNMEKECREALNAVLILEPTHTDARNRLILLAKVASPSDALQLLPEPSPHEDSETKLFRAMVLTALKRYAAALEVLATLNSPSFENHFEARLCRARAFRGHSEYEPAYIHASKAIELQANETALMLRASIVLEYWEWLRRRGLITFGEDTARRLGPGHARLIANIPNSPGLMILTDSQQIRLGSSLTSSHTPIASNPSTPSGETVKNNLNNSAALTRSILLTESKVQGGSSKMPAMNELLAIALSDLNRAVALRPNSIQSLSKRGTLLHIMGSFHPALEDLNKVLASPALQPAERPLLVLKLTRVLFDIGDHDHLLRAHDILMNQLHIALDLDILSADVATLLVIGTIPQLWKAETIVLSALQAISEHFVHAMSPRHRGPLMLLVAKLNKRISELKQLKSADMETASHTVVAGPGSGRGNQDKRGTNKGSSFSSSEVGVSSASSSSFNDSSTSLHHLEDGQEEHRKSVDYAMQAALHIEDVALLLRESAFWRQSEESDLALAYANQALMIDPSSVSAKLAKSAEQYARGEEQEVLNTLFGLPDNDPQVALYRLLASPNANNLERLEALDAYIHQLVHPANAPFAHRSLDIRMRCWITVQFHRALLLWKLSQRSAARETFEEILRALPTHPGALLHLAELCVIDGDLQAAIQYFSRRLVQCYAKRPRLHILMRIATCQQLLGAYGECLDTVQAVLELDPANAPALAMRVEAIRLNTTLGSALAYTRETVSGVTSYLKKLWQTPYAAYSSSPSNSANQDTKLQ